MAKVPPPHGKGEPPPAGSRVGNLDKPESEDEVSFNFRVPPAFRQDFKIMAAKRGKDMHEQMYECVALLKEHLRETTAS